MGTENTQGIYPVYENPEFHERLEFLRASQKWEAEKMDAYRLKKLRHLVYFASKEVPFYIDYFKSKHLSFEDIQSLKDVQKLPMVDKKSLQSDPEKFLAKNADRTKLIHRATGGSTGTPLVVYADESFVNRDKANTEYYMNVFGLSIFGRRSIRLYGDKIPQAEIDQGRYWYESALKLVMSCYDITQKTLSAYVEKIQSWKADHIHTRPSSIYPLAKLMLENDLKAQGVRNIFCDGESITKKQKEIIEQAFGARVLNIYGHTEGGAVGHPCEKSDQLHFMPQVGLIELLDPNGNEVVTPNGKGEMVVTGFNNYAFPLIRYRTGDIAIRGKKCDCGRNYQMIEMVEGRVQDYVVSKADAIVPLAPAVFNYNDFDWKGVKEFQVVQKEIGKLEFLIETDSGVNAEEICKRVSSGMSGILGVGFQVSVRSVTSIPKTKIGKHRYLIQHLDLSKRMRHEA